MFRMSSLRPGARGWLAALCTLLMSVSTQAATRWSLAVHGGAGVIEKERLTPEKESAYREALRAALSAGEKILQGGGTSLDAVEAAVRALEDDPLFNAGRGAVFTAEGRNELDASIMDGGTLAAGAVAGVTRTKNPISLARAVMARSPHVMLARDGADAFSREHGLEQVEPEYFRTEERWQQFLLWQREQRAGVVDFHAWRFGTVGAVALDRQGNLAAATSTGGMTGKRWGRIGDSPVIGAGTYAANGVCAVSATGWGEFFIRASVARQIGDRIAWKRQSVQAATDATIAEVGRMGGDGGVIALDARGRVAFAMNSPGMYRGWVSEGGQPRTAIYAGD
jgi:beta-aspartyl-peptidase (threonine type)